MGEAKRRRELGLTPRGPKRQKILSRESQKSRLCGLLYGLSEALSDELGDPTFRPVRMGELREHLRREGPGGMRALELLERRVLELGIGEAAIAEFDEEERRGPQVGMGELKALKAIIDRAVR
jgi:hypothetical protein